MISSFLSCVNQTWDMISVYHITIISCHYPVLYHILSISYHVHQTDSNGFSILFLVGITLSIKNIKYNTIGMWCHLWSSYTSKHRCTRIGCVSNTDTPRILVDMYLWSIKINYFNFKKIFYPILIRYFIDTQWYL